MMSTDFEVTQHAVSRLFCYFLLLRSGYYPQHLFSKTLNLCYFLRAGNNFSHPHKTASVVILSNNLICILFREKTTKDPEINYVKHSPNIICFSFFINVIYSVIVFSKCMNFTTFSKYPVATFIS
jgi:hypothetical protein